MSEKHKKAGSTASLHQSLGVEENQQAMIEALQAKLTEAEEKAAQHYDRMLRLQAENDNTLRRVERDIANAHKYGLEKFVLELLPIKDNLRRSLEAGDPSDPVIEGVEMTLNMFKTAMAKFGVEEVNPLGQSFNPEFHQAVSTQVDPSVKPNTVLNVLQTGYLLNNRLVRPAMVVVSKA